METALIVLAAACACLSAACAWYVFARSVPARVQRASREAQDAVEQLEAEWRAYKTSIDAWIEEASGVLESVERKRRRIAGHVSASGNGAAGEPGPTASPEQIRAFFEMRARQRGLL